MSAACRQGSGYRKQSECGSESDHTRNVFLAPALALTLTPRPEPHSEFFGKGVTKGSYYFWHGASGFSILNRRLKGSLFQTGQPVHNWTVSIHQKI